MINSYFLKKLKKIIIVIQLVAYFGCYKSLATTDSNGFTILKNKIGVCKNLDDASIVLANGQNISNLAIERNIEIKEYEEEEVVLNNNIDICFILDCSNSMSVNNRMDTLKLATNRFIENLNGNFNVRVMLISFGDPINEYLAAEYRDYFVDGLTRAGGITSVTVRWLSEI